MPQFTTGPTLLPDIGTLQYNGCSFSPLFQSKISGKFIPDEAGRTIKYTELELLVDGYVTIGRILTAGISINPTIASMHTALQAQGGKLQYTGRGFDIIVNANTKDVRWGPKPELIDFQPLGGGLSAKVTWKVTVCIYGAPAGSGFALWGSRQNRSNLLQFNYNTSVEYGEDNFSTLSIQGILEIPLTRTTQTKRTLDYTADHLRPVIYSQVMKGIDLSRFRITDRVFEVSRDKRTLTWNVTAVEKPYMDLPPNCSIARGSYDVKPKRAGPGLCQWLCSLKATYTLRNDVARRQAYELFLALMRLRMQYSEKGNIPGVADGAPAQNPGPSALSYFAAQLLGLGAANQLLSPAPVNTNNIKKAMLIDFTISEGVYLDSKSITFGATWWITTTWTHIILASGLWRKVQETDASGNNLWVTSMTNVSGVNSWLDNRLDPALDVIVDFGS